MLVITRREGEEVVIRDRDGGQIGIVRVVSIKGDRIRLAFDFPREIEVNRRELDDQKLIERKGSGPGGSPVVGGVAPSPMRGGL